MKVFRNRVLCNFDNKWGEEEDYESNKKKEIGKEERRETLEPWS